MKIKLSDFVVEHLVARGVTDIFLVSGGGIMHLCDSVGRSQGMRYVCNYHEQACAIAAEAFARVSGRIGFCLATTGPGAVNALSGLVGAWFDSIPVLVLSGQVRTPLIADYARLRQFGPQEANIIPMVRPVTKYAVQVRDPRTIRRELDRALSVATSGRPGPVWIDLPLDVQSAILEESDLLPSEGMPASDSPTGSVVSAAAEVLDALSRALRPVLVLGNGVRLAGGANLVEPLLEHVRVPVLLPIGGMDLLAESHPLHLGAFGPVGRRSSNFALQNSDLVVSVGAGLGISAIGFNVKGLAPRAAKILVNVDEGELGKGTVEPARTIRADARVFLLELLRQAGERPLRCPDRWRDACAAWKRRYPAVESDARSSPGWVSSYVFVDVLSGLLGDDDIVVTGNSLDACSVYQAFRVRQGQRVLISVNCGAMGWDLPAAVGAAIAHREGRVVLVTGDGSLQFNVQELQTIRQYGLNVKVFVFNNDGYESIRTTQDNWFEGRYVGAGTTSGVGAPDFATLAAAYGFAYRRARENTGLEEVVREALETTGPMLCELLLSPTQGRTPRLSSFKREDGTLESRSLEDMFPFLSREEIEENMHVFDRDDG